MNLNSQVNTAELSEADLDNVSGGLAADASGALAGNLSGVLAGHLQAETPVGGVCAGVVGAASAEGVAAGLHVNTTGH
ncbi:type A2 lantipeptide [Streptomyces sp. NPDC002787]